MSSGAAEVLERSHTAQRTWKQNGLRLTQRLLCCSCIRAPERTSSPETRERCIRSLDDAAERENVRITVEDLGMDNPSYVRTEDDAPKERRAVGRSASSVSACHRAWQKKKLTPLSSLPLQPKAVQSSLNSEEEADSLIFGSRSDGALLTPPVINLIPPTPSDVIDDDQFFDINSEEESVAHTSGSECVDSMGSQAFGDQESDTDGVQKTDDWDSGPDRKSHSDSPVMDKDEKTGSPTLTTVEVDNSPGESPEGKTDQTKRPTKPNFLHSAFQVAPLPEYPRKRSFNTGINLLQFTEQNLDDLNNKDANSHELLKAELRLLPFSTKMDLRKPAARTCSLGDTVPRSHTFHSVTKGSEEVLDDEGSPRQRRITVASYIPQSKDQNGNFAGKQESEGCNAKSLAELNTEEVCRWFANIGLQKCLPFIREADLRGSHIASIDPDILQILHVSALEERELLLSAVYRELHPPDTTTQKLDTLLETIGSHNVEKFTAALVSMSKSKSSPHVNYVNTSRSSFRFRDRSRNSNIQRNSHLIELTINALEQILHLRTPKETTVGRVMESCLKMLGVTDDKDLFSLRSKNGPSAEFSVDQQIGNLPGSEKRLLELHLCKKEKPEVIHYEGNGSPSVLNQNTPVRTKEEKIRELHQHVDSLQNVIHQVQELHQSLVSFCRELRSMESEPTREAECSRDVEMQLGVAQGKLQEKQQSVQALQLRLSNLEAHKNRRPEVHLLDKMRLDCQIFKEEISLIHLNRQVARLKIALQECQAKECAQKKSSTLGQLVSPQSPAILLASHERQNAGGQYGFVARFTEGNGLVVVHVDNSQLCLNDRLVEVNGVNVLESNEEELSVLLRQPCARIVVLRKPPPLPPKPSHTRETIQTGSLGNHTIPAAPRHHEVTAT